LLLGLSQRLRLVLEPLIIILNGIPKIVLYPVLLPIFSLSGSKVVMGVLFALFPVLINVSTGVQEIPRVYWKLAKSVQANPWQTLVHIIFPAIRRPLLTGIRLAVACPSSVSCCRSSSPPAAASDRWCCSPTVTVTTRPWSRRSCC
jgi:NitT/TauT family transport system permease protein